MIKLKFLQNFQSGFFNDYEREFHRTFDEHFNEVIKKYINNEGPPIHADAGKRTLELALASIKSFKTNKTVEL